MDAEKYVEIALTGETPEEEYIHFIIPMEDYLRYDDNDLYSENYFLEEK